MNKKLIAVAVSSALAAPVIAQAEGELKLYGRINQAISLKDASGADSKTNVSNVVSRFGIRYDNDLGNGLAVHARYEFGVNADRELGGGFPNNGSGDSDRQLGDIRIATVGLSGAFGRLDVGNQWSAYFNTFGTLVSPTYTLGYYIYSGAGGPYRASNTLKYSNTFGPVHFELDGRLNGSDEGSNVAETLRGDGIGIGIRFAAGDYVTVGLAADYEDGPDLASAIKEYGNGVTGSETNSRRLRQAMAERDDTMAERAADMARADAAIARANAAQFDRARVLERQVVSNQVRVADRNLAAPDDIVGADVTDGIDTDVIGLYTLLRQIDNAKDTIVTRETAAAVAQRVLADATAAASNEDASAADRRTAEAERVIAMNREAAARLAVTTAQGMLATLEGREPGQRTANAARRATFNPVAADTPELAAIRTRARNLVNSIDNDEAVDAELVDAVAKLDEAIEARAIANVAFNDQGAIDEADAAAQTFNTLDAIAKDPARIEDTTRYGIAVQVKLGELPVSVTGGWQNVDTERSGVGAADSDVDSWFLWFTGDFNESTRWLLGYSSKDGAGGDFDDDQFTWAVYHTIGGGLKAYYEAVSVDIEEGFDGTHHLLGLRVDF